MLHIGDAPEPLEKGAGEILVLLASNESKR
jgi:hypothetical protein